LHVLRVSGSRDQSTSLGARICCGPCRHCIHDAFCGYLSRPRQAHRQWFRLVLRTRRKGMTSIMIENNLVRENFRIPSREEGIELQLIRRHRQDIKVFSEQSTIMLMHGATFASESLFDVPLAGGSFMDILARAGFDVWAVDARGYGGSTKPLALSEPADANPPQTPAVVAEKDLADAIDHICQRQGITRINLIGMSWGGSVAG